MQTDVFLVLLDALQDILDNDDDDQPDAVVERVVGWAKAVRAVAGHGADPARVRGRTTADESGAPEGGDL